MNCTEFELEAQHTLETRSSLAPMAIDHISTCADCRQSWELQQQLNDTIDAWRMVQPSTSLVDAVFAELAAPAGHVRQDSWAERDLGDRWDEEREFARAWDEHPRSSTLAPAEIRTDAMTSAGLRNRPVDRSVISARQRTRSAALAVTAVAVCMVIAALFASRFGGNVGHEMTRTRQEHTIDVARTDAPLDVSGTLTEVFFDLKSEYREMANETTAMAREMVIALPHRINTAAIPESDKLELRPNSSDMVRMLQPIGSRVESAFGFLWNAIPSELPSG